MQLSGEKKIFRGWVMVLAVFMLLATNWGTVFNTTGLLMTPIQASLGATRSQMLLGLTVRGFGMLVGSLLCSKIYSRWKLLRTLRLFLVLSAIFYLSQAFIQNLRQYYLLMFLQVIAVMLSSFVPCAIILNNWFYRKNSLVIGLAFMGSGVGGMLFNSLGAFLIPRIGWRLSLGVFGIIMFVMIAVAAFVLLRDKPSYYGLSPYGSEGLEQDTKMDARVHGGEDFSQLIRQPRYLMLGLTVALMNMALTGVYQNVTPLLIDFNYSFAFAAMIGTYVNLSLTVGKFATGLCFDRFGVRGGSLISASALVISITGMLTAKFTPGVVAIVLGVGLGSSFTSIAPPILAERLYGRKDFTRNNSFLQTMISLGSIISPTIMSNLYRISGSYASSFAFFLGMMVLVISLLIFLLPSQSKTPH